MNATIQPPETKTSDRFIQAFDALEKAGAENVPPWVRAVRTGGIAHFAELGFPTLRDEEWRFTNVAPIAALSAHRPDTGLCAEVFPRELEPFLFKRMPSTKLVFVDGRFASQLSEVTDQPGLSVVNLADALESDSGLLQQHLGRHARCETNAFVALNTAFLEDGALVKIAPGRSINHPIHIVHVSTARLEGAMSHPRVFVLAGKHSDARILESYVGLGSARYFVNAVTEIILEEGARIEHAKIQKESQACFHVATIHAHQEKHSHFFSHSVSMGALLARNNIVSVLNGQGAECVLNGLYLGQGDQLVDHHTDIHHAKPHCNSHEFYHGILDGRSTGVFNGKILVRSEAQKTDAKQNNRNLLLSEDATVHTKPQLEIFADDVKCTHGATVGQLEEDAIFYLRARGIGLENARRMLVHAFASDIVNRITMEPVRLDLDQTLFDLFEK